MATTTTEFPQSYIDENHSATIVGVVGLFYFLSLTFVGMRIYVRVFMVRSFGIDDALIILTSLLAFVSWLCLVLQTPYGLGRHGLVIPTEDRIHFEHISFWKTVLSDGVAMGVLRVSMAISILRLNHDLKWYRYSLFVLMGFVVAYTIQAIIWLFVYCHPYSGWWEFQWANPFDTRCAKFSLFLDMTYWNIACGIFTDVMLGALPVPVIWSLKMRRRVKIYVIAILNVGYLSVLMGILKAVFMLLTGGTVDLPLHYWVHFWQNLQLDIGIIAASVAFLKPLFRRVLKINSSAAQYYDSNRYGQSGPGRTGGTGRKPNASYNGLGTGHDEGAFAEGNGPRGVNNASPVDTTIRAEPVSKSQDFGSENATTFGGVHSDGDSEEIMLQELRPSNGIVQTRDITVEYSKK